jgi:hypothetical protein
MKNKLVRIIREISLFILVLFISIPASFAISDTNKALASSKVSYSIPEKDLSAYDLADLLGIRVWESNLRFQEYKCDVSLVEFEDGQVIKTIIHLDNIGYLRHLGPAPSSDKYISAHLLVLKHNVEGTEYVRISIRNKKLVCSMAYELTQGFLPFGTVDSALPAELKTGTYVLSAVDLDGVKKDFRSISNFKKGIALIIEIK